MVTWVEKVDARLEGEESAIAAEAHAIGEIEANRVFLLEAPLRGTLSVSIDGTPAALVDGLPAAGQARAFYSDEILGGRIDFHASDNGKAVLASYDGTGSGAFAHHINQLQDFKADTDEVDALILDVMAEINGYSDDPHTWASLQTFNGGVAVNGVTTIDASRNGFFRNLTLERSGANTAFMLKITGESFYRLTMAADGGMSWGDGAAVQDTNLYRSAADTLRTDDSFVAVNLTILSGGILTFADGTTMATAVTGGSSTTISDTAPASPSDGDMWWNSDLGNGYVYYDDGTTSQWVEFSARSTRVPISSTPPASPVHEQLWYDSDEGTLYIRYDDGITPVWVEV